MREWIIQSLGVLESLRAAKVTETVEFLKSYRVPLLKTVASLWGVLLLMLFSLIFTIRLALNIPL